MKNEVAVMGRTTQETRVEQGLSIRILFANSE